MHYTQSHEWILLKDNVGTVGISEYAQNELGEVVYIELPEVGKEVSAGKEVCVLESTKAAADVYAPVSGKIVAVNENLRKNPGLVNQNPQDTGWLFQIELKNPEEVEKLLTIEQYKKLISG